MKHDIRILNENSQTALKKINNENVTTQYGSKGVDATPFIEFSDIKEYLLVGGNEKEAIEALIWCFTRYLNEKKILDFLDKELEDKNKIYFRFLDVLENLFNR